MARTQWQYKTVPRDDATDTWLNSMGAGGWELAATRLFTRGRRESWCVEYIFKRPIAHDDENAEDDPDGVFEVYNGGADEAETNE